MRETLIGMQELCDLVGVAPHVVRYWEEEFPMLRPSRDAAGKRTFDPTAVRVTLRIRELLYAEKLTLAGARRRLSAEFGTGGSE
jgi:DNA-binding transcriptional MerR regulator